MTARIGDARAEEVTGMLDEAELRLMSPEERARLARALAALDLPAPLDDPKTANRRKLVVGFTAACCVILAAWIVVLALTLPSGFRAEHWRGVWVGFDIAELLAFCSVAWAAWRGRQILILCLIVTATLLCCDAWFDLTLDWGTRWFWLSVASAAFVELPLAVLMLIGVRRMLRLNARAWMTLEGEAGPVPPLWQLRFFGRPVPLARRRGAAADSAPLKGVDVALPTTSGRQRRIDHERTGGGGGRYPSRSTAVSAPGSSGSSNG